MILLDTNVISEIMRRVPDPKVAEWLRGQPISSLFTTAITEAEIYKGIAIMAQGKKRSDLLGMAQAFFHVDMASRILPFDSNATDDFAEIFALRKRAGRMIQPLELQIAAITRQHEAVLATRNIDDFSGCGIELINPWQAR